MLLYEDVVRRRIACSPNISASVSTLQNTPRPPAFPGTQQVDLRDYDFRGTLYPNSVHAADVALFVSPGDVEDAAYYAGGCEEQQRGISAWRLGGISASVCWVEYRKRGELCAVGRRGVGAR